MRSVTVRGMSRGGIGLTVLATVLMAGSGFSFATSGGHWGRATALCGGIEAGSPAPPECDAGVVVRPGIREGLRAPTQRYVSRLDGSESTAVTGEESPALSPSSTETTVSLESGAPGVGDAAGLGRPSDHPGRSGEAPGLGAGPPRSTPPPEEPTPPEEPEPETPEEPTPPEEPEPETPGEPTPPEEPEPETPEEPTPPEEPAPPVEVAGCDQTVSSASAAQSALGSAAAGSVVCLANGTYGGLSLSASKAAPGVTLTAANPGGARIGSVSVSGSGYTISRLVIDGGVSISRNVDRTVVDHNRILGGNHYGVFVCTAEPPDQCNDTEITGNVFDGAMDEDQVRANVYHDGDGDGIGLLVEGNEFRGNTERGGHNDAFQTVWIGDHLVFRRNYLHDFGGQGFFVKDQGQAINGFIANNNLIVDQDLPCEPASLCSGYQLSPWQVFGPIANGEIRHNTVGWGSGGGTAVLTGTYTNIDFSDNVFNRLSVTDSGGSVPSVGGTNNTYCDSSGWGVPTGSSRDCDPAFLDPAAGDYRLADGRGVTWAPAEVHFGP